MAEDSRSQREPSMIEDEEALVSLMSQKALALSAQVAELLPRMENFFGVTIAIVVGAIGLGLAEKHPAVFVLLPLLLLPLYVYLVQANTEMLSRAGHMFFLEERVNQLLGRQVMLEEEFVAPTLHGKLKIGRLSIILIQTLSLTVLLVLLGLAVANLHHVHGIGWRISFVIAATVGMLTLGAGVREQMRAYDRAYEAAKHGFEGGEPTDPTLLSRAR